MRRIAIVNSARCKPDDSAARRIFGIGSGGKPGRSVVPGQSPATRIFRIAAVFFKTPRAIRALEDIDAEPPAGRLNG